MPGEPRLPRADVDLFVYGLTMDEAKNKLREIYRAVSRAIEETKPGAGLLVVRTQHAVTFVNGFPFRRVQVILRIYKSPAEVLIGFDVDSCCAGFDGEAVKGFRRQKVPFVDGAALYRSSPPTT